MNIHRKAITAIMIAVALSFTLATIVLAAATFGTLTGPTWLNPGYQWTVEVISISNPDKVVCLETTINGSTTNQLCDCNAPDCDAGTSLGTWVCTIPNNIPNSTIEWRTGTWSAGGGNSCGSERTNADSGTFTTGPNAVTLASLAAHDSRMTGLLALLSGLGALGAGVFVVRRRLLA